MVFLMSKMVLFWTGTPLLHRKLPRMRFKSGVISWEVFIWARAQMNTSHEITPLLNLMCGNLQADGVEKGYSGGEKRRKEEKKRRREGKKNRAPSLEQLYI